MISSKRLSETIHPGIVPRYLEASIGAANVRVKPDVAFNSGDATNGDRA